MASGKTSIEPVERKGLATSAQSVFRRQEGLRLLCYPVLPLQQLQVADSSPKTRQLGGSINEKMFQPTDRARYSQTQEGGNRRVLSGDATVTRDPLERPDCSGSGIGIERGSGGGLAEEDDEDVDEDDPEEDEGLDGGKDYRVSSNVNHLQRKDYQFENVLPISALSGDGHFVRVENVSEAPTFRRTAMPITEKGSASTQCKEAPINESVRSILSDPFTALLCRGALMDDAVIFPCGHSFGAGGYQHSLQKKACYTCSLPITEESVHRNLTLHAAVAAFRREEYDNRSSKRKRDWAEEKADMSDSNRMDSPRSRSLQFPFAVADRVVIMGNKRTPQRFVGREAIITSQCLNGWYVVKTLDNGESVKLQYRSFAKVP